MKFVLRNLPRHQGIWKSAQYLSEEQISSVELFLQFLRVSSDVLAALQTHLGRYSLSDGKLSVLMSLYIAEERALTPSQIAERIGVKRGTITDLLTGLERAELIEREASASDARMMLVRLSQQGKTLLEQLLPEHYQRIGKLMQALNKLEQEELRELLGKIAQHVTALQDP